MKINAKSLLYGTLVLTCANFLVRVLGFIYRVLLSRLIGPQGMGLIQMVFPVYLITITITVSGIPVAVSRLISEKKARGDFGGIKRVIATALLLVTIISIILSIITLISLDFIATDILKDQRTRGALFIFFPCIIIVGLGAVLKGFFYGMKDIHPPALSEIIEQIVRMAIALTLLYWLSPKDHAIAAAIVILGMVIGELASLLFLHYRYHSTRKQIKENRRIASTDNALKAIAAIAIPITLTRLASSFMTATNTIMIPRRLMTSGLPADEAVGLFGIASGMVMPLLFLPFTITSALAVVIIPNLSENLALKNWSDIRDKVSKALSITCITAFPSVALLVSLGEPMGNMLYRQPLVGKLLVPMAYALVFHALQHTSSGILNGLGKQNRGAAHFMIGGSIQLAATYFLVANPKYGIYGFIIGFFISSIIVSTLNLTAVLSFTKQTFHFKQWVIKPGLSALIMGVITRLCYQFLINSVNFPVVLSLILAFVIGITIFFITLFSIGGFPTVLFKEILHKDTNKGKH